MAVSDRTKTYARIFGELPPTKASELLLTMGGDPDLSARSEVVHGAAIAVFVNRMWPQTMALHRREERD